MAKRNAEDAGLNEPQNEEDNEERQEEHDEDNASNADGKESEENDEDDSEGDSSDSGPDDEHMRSFAMAWLEDKRFDGLTPQSVFESLGMKVV